MSPAPTLRPPPTSRPPTHHPPTLRTMPQPAPIQFAVSIYEDNEDRVAREVIFRFKHLEAPLHKFQSAMLDKLGFDSEHEGNAIYYRTAPRFGWQLLTNQYSLTIWVLFSWWFHESSLLQVFTRIFFSLCSNCDEQVTPREIVKFFDSLTVR